MTEKHTVPVAEIGLCLEAATRGRHRWPPGAEGRLPSGSEMEAIYRRAMSTLGQIRIRDLALRACTTLILAVGTFQAHAAVPGAPSLLMQRPPQAAAKACRAPPPALPLGLDWHAWKGTEPGIAPDRMLADAIRFLEGDSTIPRDLPLARRMLEHLATGASNTAPDAKIRLATVLLDVRSGEPDAQRAKRLLSQATMSQRTGAALTMGRLIRDGKLPDATMDEAVRYLSVAAGLGDPAAALQLAAIYGQAGAAEPAEGSASHFDALATINVQTALAAGNCGIAVEVGEYLLDIGAGTNQIAAADWFEFAADAGDMRGVARLARAYEHGEGRAADRRTAAALWDKAVDGGAVQALAPAARLRIEAGEDLDTASKLLDRAIANGDRDAGLLAARLYRGDYDGRPDFTAMHATLTRIAAGSDMPVAINEIRANAFMTGQGVQIDREKAESLYRDILETGGIEGRAVYGRHLIDIGEKLADAQHHLQAAAEGGSQVAAFDLAEIALCRADAQAETMMKDVATKGYAAAFRRLGRLAVDRGDLGAASDLFAKAADRGDRLAMVELAVLARDGKATNKADLAALLKRATAPGPDMVEGRLALAAAYRSDRLDDMGGQATGLLDTIAATLRPDVDVEIARAAIKSGGSLNLEAVTTRLRSAADAGNSDAMLLLSRMTISGSPTKQWVVAAARRGEATALSQLTPDDPALLDDVLSSLNQRLICDIPALVQQARLYSLRGDQTAASGVMQMADKLAQRRGRDLHVLAEAYADEGPGMPNNSARAAVLFEKAASVGHAKSALALAQLLGSGRLGDQTEKTVDWYRRAASSGDPAARKELLRYAGGQAGETTAKAALAALKQVAEQGDVQVMQAYGSLLVTLDPDRHGEGIGFLEAAAWQGDVPAMKILARLHAAGINGRVSASESTQWTRLAAEKGDPEAMFQYAIALDLGFGVETDRKSAQSWHERAKKNGFFR